MKWFFSLNCWALQEPGWSNASLGSQTTSIAKKGDAVVVTVKPGYCKAFLLFKGSLDGKAQYC